MKKKNEKLGFKIEVDDEELQDSLELMKEAMRNMPDVTIRGNEVVNVTINYHAGRDRNECSQI